MKVDYLNFNKLLNPYFLSWDLQKEDMNTAVSHLKSFLPSPDPKSPVDRWLQTPFYRLRKQETGCDTLMVPQWGNFLTV